MSLAVYAPPRAILPIFNPVDFPDSFTSATSSTANYTTAITTLNTINTNLLAYQTKLNNVGTGTNSTFAPFPSVNYVNGLNSITTVGTSSAWAIWACAILKYGITGTTTTPSTAQIAYASDSLPSPVNSQEIRPITNITYFTTQPFGYFQLNTVNTWTINCNVNTVAPVGTSTIGISVPSSSPSTMTNIYFISIK